ncbi:MAG: MBL fold metallo-hydrolase [Christensenellaceae bacterium]
MKLTVLGKYGPYPSKSGGTSSYLLECGHQKILIDAGCGTLSRVQEFCALQDINLILLSHLHADHCCEMFVLRYALKKPVEVYLPPLPKEEYDLLCKSDCFCTTAINSETVIEQENLKISFCEMSHPVLCYAIKVQYNQKTLVFSGDTIYSDALINFAKDAEVLLCDSGFLSTYQSDKPLPHMFTAQAAQTAQNAHVGRLLLTHINPCYDEQKIIDEATAIFKNTVVVQENTSYEI